MKKGLFILISMSILLIVGCSNKKTISEVYSFNGENDNWTVELKINSQEIFTKKMVRLNMIVKVKKSLLLLIRKMFLN